MTYKVVLQSSEEGYSVQCPELPGCWSQGATEEEALENIRVAIEEYLAAVDDARGRVPGSAKGQFTVPEDFDAPVEDFREYT